MMMRLQREKRCCEKSGRRRWTVGGKWAGKLEGERSGNEAEIGKKECPKKKSNEKEFLDCVNEKAEPQNSLLSRSPLMQKISSYLFKKESPAPVVIHHRYYVKS